jgi:hypothetical protein
MPLVANRLCMHQLMHESTIEHMPKLTSHSSQPKAIVSRDLDVRVVIDRSSSDESMAWLLKWLGLPKTVDKARRRTRGDSRANELLEWVNCAKSTRVQKQDAERIDAVLTLLLQLNAMAGLSETGPEQRYRWHGRTFSANEKIVRSTGLPSETPAQEGLRNRLNSQLRRFRFSPRYFASLGDRHLFGWASFGETPTCDDDPNDFVDCTEQDAILSLMELCNEGLLGNISKCNCGDWFYKNFVHQKFCCTLCQQRHYRSSAEWKAKRRSYMRELRALHKTGRIWPKAASGNRKRVFR